MGVVVVRATDVRDYSAVDTREKAWRAVERDDLVAILMCPATFGGEEVDENIVFVPEAIAEQKERIDHEVVVPMVEAGKVVEYRVTPKHGASFVPVSLEIWISEPTNLEPIVYQLQIWDDPDRDSGARG